MNKVYLIFIGLVLGYYFISAIEAYKRIPSEPEYHVRVLGASAVMCILGFALCWTIAIFLTTI